MGYVDCKEHLSLYLGTGWPLTNIKGNNIKRYVNEVNSTPSQRPDTYVKDLPPNTSNCQCILMWIF